MLKNINNNYPRKQSPLEELIKRKNSQHLPVANFHNPSDSTRIHSNEVSLLHCKPNNQKVLGHKSGLPSSLKK